MQKYPLYKLKIKKEKKWASIHVSYDAKYENTQFYVKKQQQQTYSWR